MGHLKNFFDFISESQDWKDTLKRFRKMSGPDTNILSKAYSAKKRYGVAEVEKNFDMPDLLWQFILNRKSDRLDVTDYNLEKKDQILYIDIFLKNSNTPNLSVIFDTRENKEGIILSKYKGNEIYFHNNLPKYKKYDISKPDENELKDILMDFILDFYAWWEIANEPRYVSFSKDSPHTTKKQMRGNPISWETYKNYY